MVSEIKELLKKYALTPSRYTIKRNTCIIDTEKGRFVIKRKIDEDIVSTYNYLNSRSFDYFPQIVLEDNNYYVYEYLEDSFEPVEQKTIDIINLMALLHNKTTFYQEIDIDDYKAIYEDVISKINYLYNYYTDIINIVERSVYMSPSEYLFARNISKIYESLKYAKQNIDTWYRLIKDKRKRRVVNIHNNIRIDHYLKTNKPNFISWNKSKIDMPIYDFLNFYKNHYLEFDFYELLKQYECKYPLLEEERILLFVLMSIPDKFSFSDSQYEDTKKLRLLYDYIYKTQYLITEYTKTCTTK